MKNIHILPTPNPSCLVLETVNNNLFLTTTKSFPTNIMKFQNIYITSDEKPKQGEWSLYQNKIHKCIEDIIGDEFKKIILTTDQDLIKDGIQTIDDEFLEWFVKNPSCEEVEVNKLLVGKDIPKINFTYKIIIPKQEPRILTVEAFNKAKISYKEPKQDKIMERFIANAKQETLEEIKQSYFKNGFKEGAKWQQEQIGKSEFLQKLRGTMSDAEARRLILEQFKKK